MGQLSEKLTEEQIESLRSHLDALMSMSSEDRLNYFMKDPESAEIINNLFKDVDGGLDRFKEEYSALIKGQAGLFKDAIIEEVGKENPAYAEYIKEDVNSKTDKAIEETVAKIPEFTDDFKMQARMMLVDRSLGDLKDIFDAREEAMDFVREFAAELKENPDKFICTDERALEEADEYLKILEENPLGAELVKMKLESLAKLGKVEFALNVKGVIDQELADAGKASLDEMLVAGNIPPVSIEAPQAENGGAMTP